MIVLFFADPRDDRVARVIGAAADALGPAFGVILRDKSNRDDRAVIEDARQLCGLAQRSRARFLVGDRFGLALELGADGVHVSGKRSVAEARRVVGAGGLVTAACHDDDDVRRAAHEGASAAVVSPLWETPGKGAPRGVAALSAARAAAPNLMLYGLGGVDAARSELCASAGADGVAVIRALTESPDAGAASAASKIGEAARALAAPFASRKAR
jgi:thiamine-phosphate diphosphorylase